MVCVLIDPSSPKRRACSQDAPIDRIAILDHIPPFALDPLVEAKLVQVEASGLVAEAIRRGRIAPLELLEA